MIALVKVCHFFSIGHFWVGHPPSAPHPFRPTPDRLYIFLWSCRGARHGLKLNGKLERIQEQERLLLEKWKKQKESSSVIDQSERLSLTVQTGTDVCENVSKAKKKKKKRNRDTDVQNQSPESTDSHDRQEGQEVKKKKKRKRQIELVEIDTEPKRTKKKKKKLTKCDDSD